MKHQIKLWQLWGFAITCFTGTILHFLYDWLNQSKLISPFSGVNESTWEHMKLLFWPMFLFAVIQSFWFKEDTAFWCVKLRGILLGLILIPIIFYTYNGAIDKSPDWLNIAIFFIAATISFCYEAKQFNNNFVSCKNSNLAFFMLCIVGLLFIVFTFHTPKLNIFEDPLTNTYGIKSR